MPLRKGDFIGAYEIVAPLGQGGMATVYKAFHARLNRFVAIKMIHQAYLQDPNYLARFEREAQIVAGLEHLHIVPVYDFSEHEGEPYLVMKLIEGTTLKATLNERKLPVSEALSIITPIASALDYAHGRGVLHRDIKPSNILLDQTGTPYLTDFGLARLSLSGASTLSQDLLIGTPYYMSPEQANGKIAIDHRSDLYSFGVVLFELFVGQVPFSEGTPYAIITDHIQKELPLPRSLNPDVSPAVEAVLLQALAKDREDRYQSASALAAAMQNALLDDPATSLPHTVILTDTEPVAPGPTDPTRATRKTDQVAKAALDKGRPRISCSVEIVLAGAAVALILVLVAGLVLRTRQANVEPTTVAVVPTQTLVDALPAPVGGESSSAPAPTATPVPRNNTLPPTRTVPPTRPAADRPLPTVPPLVVPNFSEAEARLAIQRNPNEVGAYLALARAQLQDGQDVAARRTFTDGLSHAPDRVRYLMTAASIAVDVARYDAAFTLYSTALQEAQGQPPYQAVRETAGSYLYTAATLNGRLTLIQIRALDQEVRNNTSPIVSAMIGRAFLNSGMPRLAEAGINRALGQDGSLPEAHLVNGELEQSRGNTDNALAEWQLALDAPDAPPWVRSRATQLINSLTSD